MDLKKTGGQCALFLTALIWGLAFVAQKDGMEHLSPLVFTSIRFLLGGIFLIPVIAVLDRIGGKKVSLCGSAQPPEARQHLLRGGLFCGLALGCATALQQTGLVTASAGKAGFLTALYIIAVPVAGLLFHKKTTGLLWIAVFMALGGSFLLCSPDGNAALTGADLLLIGSALLFTVHILVIDHFAPGTDCVRMSCIQFFTAGILAGIGGLLCGDSWNWSAICGAAIPVLYCGFFSSGIAYTLQIAGQKYINPTAASLIMSLESVFAAIGGWILLHEQLTHRELLGCAVIFGAVILVQIPYERKKQRKTA